MVETIERSFVRLNSIPKPLFLKKITKICVACAVTAEGSKYIYIYQFLIFLRNFAHVSVFKNISVPFLFGFLHFWHRDMKITQPKTASYHIYALHSNIKKLTKYLTLRESTSSLKGIFLIIFHYLESLIIIKDWSHLKLVCQAKAKSTARFVCFYNLISELFECP